MRRFRLAAAAILLLSTLGVSRADSAWRYVSAADGLPAGAPTALIEDHAGGLWAGTTDGLGRYDGLTWGDVASPGMAGVAVTSLAEDPSGAIWIGSTRGVARYADGRWSSVPPTELPAAAVRLVLAAPDGDVWVAFVGHGVARWRNGAWFRWERDVLGSNEIVAGVLDGTGHPWFATGAGLVHYDGVDWISLPVAQPIHRLFRDQAGRVWSGGDDQLRRWPDPLPPGNELAHVRAFAETDDGTVWVGTEGGLFRLGPSGPEPVVTGLDEPGVALLQPDRQDGLWVAGESGGLVRIDAFSRRVYAESEYGGSRVRVSLCDRPGNLWFGLDGPAGLSETDGASWTDYSTVIGGAGSPRPGRVKEVARFADGTLGFGTVGGAAFFDGEAWRFESPIADAEVRALLSEEDGVTWAGTSLGLARRGPSAWEPVIGGVSVGALFRDSGGRLWVGTDSAGIIRLTGSTRETLSTEIGGKPFVVRAVAAGAGEVVWVGTDHGLLRFDEAGQAVIRAGTGGLVSDAIQDVAIDLSGRLWVATGQGIGILDGGTWSRITEAEPGLTSPDAWSVRVDQHGDVWVGTSEGVSRWSQGRWHSFGSVDGLPGAEVLAIAEDPAGQVWFGTPEGLARFAVDRVAPRSVFNPVPASLVGSLDWSVSFAAADAEVTGVTFRVDVRAVDGGGIVASTGGPTAVRHLETILPRDGRYEVLVRAEDALGNLEVDPATASFEVDATPPTPTLASPRPGDPVRGNVTIAGSAIDDRFREYRVDVRPLEGDWRMLVRSTIPVQSGPLVAWDTRSLPDGDYVLRVTVADTLGLTGAAEVGVIVDNAAPDASITTPVRIVSQVGGDVWTTNSEAHLYLPPAAFREDTVVRLDLVAAGTGAEPPPEPAISGPIVRVGFGGGTLLRPAVLDLDIRAVDGEAPVINWRPSAAASWLPIGGTPDEARDRLRIPIDSPGEYALIVAGPSPAGSETLGAVTATPRIVQPDGQAGPGGVLISFSLAREADVTVRVFNRSGRLVREVISSVPLGPGANVVRWDLQTRDGDDVEGGLFFVAVEAADQTRTTSVAVVR